MTAQGQLSSPGRVLWPQAGLTKADLAEYYERVAARLLPVVADRPLTLVRHPRGVDHPGFVQKHLGDSAPDHVRRFRSWSPSSQRDVDYAVVDDARDLAWLAQVSAVELHPWFTRIDRPDRCDTLAFDLDPPDAGRRATDAALALRGVLDELGLKGRVKTSGKRGLHIYVAVQRRYDHTLLRGLALAVARCCADRHPDDLTVHMRKADRGGRLLLDWSRNGPAQTLVAAWSPRADPRATVSTPLAWQEVVPGLDPGTLTIRTVLDRPDPWAAPPRAQRLEHAVAVLQEQGYDCADANPRARTPP